MQGQIQFSSVRGMTQKDIGILKEGRECYFQCRLAAILPESQIAFLQAVVTPAGKSELINNMLFRLLTFSAAALTSEIAFHVYASPDLGESVRVRDIITFYWIETVGWI